MCWLGALFLSMWHMYGCVFTEFYYDGKLAGLLAHVDGHCDGGSHERLKMVMETGVGGEKTGEICTTRRVLHEHAARVLSRNG